MQVLHGLAHLHDLGLPHGALSLHNVIISPAGWVQLVGVQSRVTQASLRAASGTPRLEAVLAPQIDSGTGMVGTTVNNTSSQGAHHLHAALHVLQSCSAGANTCSSSGKHTECAQDAPSRGSYSTWSPGFEQLLMLPLAVLTEKWQKRQVCKQPA